MRHPDRLLTRLSAGFCINAIAILSLEKRAFSGKIIMVHCGQRKRGD